MVQTLTAYSVTREQPYKPDVIQKEKTSQVVLLYRGLNKSDSSDHTLFFMKGWLSRSRGKGANKPLKSVDCQKDREWKGKCLSQI